MKKILCIALSLAAVSALAADVNVSSVNDRRGTGSFSRLTITLSLPRIKATEVSAARVFVSSAVDETGRDLIGDWLKDPRFAQTSSYMQRDDAATQPAEVEVSLKNPDRKATKVSEVKGEIELFMPSKDPNSVAEIPKFLGTAGKPVSNKALKANGVELSLLSQAQIDAERKKVVDAKRKEATGTGLSGDDLETYIKSETDSALRLEDGEVLIRVKDPNKVIQEIVYVNPAGEVKQVSTSTSDGFTTLSTWGDKVQPDWKLRVSMRTGKNLVKQAFVLRDVALP